MKSHQLAKILLAGPDLQVLTHANNHDTEGEELRVALIRCTYAEQVVIGNFDRDFYDGEGNNGLHVRYLKAART